MDHSPRLESLVSPTLDQMGYEVVRVMMQGKTRPTLQIMAERKDGMAMGVEDCAAISRALSAVLDVADPISGAYVLEVSSPGIDRPLTRPKDFVRWAGFDARVETDMPIDGQKRFKGRLLGLDDTGRAGLTTDVGDSWIPLPQIRSAKLILTDALIKAVAKDETQG